MKQTIGMCLIVSTELHVVVYIMETYELALAQALENCKGVEVSIARHPERRNPKNGMRETVFMLMGLGELIQVQECEVGEAVLPVSGTMPTIVNMPWPLPGIIAPHTSKGN